MGYWRDPVRSMRRLREDYGELCVLSKGSHCNIFAFGPVYNKEVLGNPDLYYRPSITLPGPEGSALRRLSRGILSLNGEEHRETRRIMTPAFHRMAIQGYVQDILAVVDDVLDGWKVGEMYFLDVEMKKLTLRIAARLLFGVELGDSAQRIGDDINRWLSMNYSLPVLLFPHSAPFTPYRNLLMLSDRLEKLVLGTIEQKRADPSQRRDVLLMLMTALNEEGRTLSDEELTGQIITLFIAGHETSSSALTWTLFLLAQHPHILSNLLEELSLLPAEFDVEKAVKLPLLDRVVKESLRILPPVTSMVRYATRDTALGGYPVSKGRVVEVSNYITHHEPSLYPDPERFDPDRWLTHNPGLYEYLPFGAGVRTCVGSTLAVYEMKIVLSRILGRYALQPADRLTLNRKNHITMSPRERLPVLIQPRDWEVKKSRVEGNIREMVELK